MSLEGKACIVTGASRGIGEAVARRLTREKARLCLVARSAPALKALALDLAGEGEPPLVMSGDVTDESQVKTVVAEALAHFGGVDILINSAGSVRFGPLEDTSLEMWDEVVDSNLKGAFLFCKHVVPQMLARGQGDIVSIASIAAHQGFSDSTAYCAAKHGILGFSRALAAEVRKRGLRVITVTPGAVDTPAWDAMTSTPPREKMLRPEDVAEAVVSSLRMPPHATVDELVLMPREGVL